MFLNKINTRFFYSLIFFTQNFYLEKIFIIVLSPKIHGKRKYISFSLLSIKFIMIEMVQKK